jgi:hybrid polyketide synthase/nonribosomal peptide synthetase ACE1
LGRAILAQLVQNERVQRIYCIAVRHPETLNDVIFRDSKVVLHQGDLAAPRLGLANTAADAIFAEATAIIHNGADVSFLKPYAALRAANVESTRELVRLAAPHGTPLHYISTGGVAQFAAGGRRRTVGEESLFRTPPRADLDKGVDGRHPGIAVGYAASKWASEVLVEKASAQLRLPVTVHRMTNVTSDSGFSSGPSTGEPVSDVVDSLLRYSRVIGAVPISDIWGSEGGELDFVSLGTVVEGVVEAVVEQGRDCSKLLRFLHHAGEVRIPLEGAKAYLERQSGRALRVVPLEVWVVEAEMAGLSPLIAEVLVETERSGQKVAFPRLVKGKGSTELVTVRRDSGLLKTMWKMAGGVSALFVQV